MNLKLFEEAQRLAARRYQMHFFADETTDGEPVYVAVVPEMPGCIAHGDTVEDAMEWLESAKLDHIWLLLDHCLEVPEPQLINTVVVFEMPQYKEDDAGTGQASNGLIISTVPA